MRLGLPDVAEDAGQQWCEALGLGGRRHVPLQRARQPEQGITDRFGQFRRALFPLLSVIAPIVAAPDVSQRKILALAAQDQPIRENSIVLATASTATSFTRTASPGSTPLALTRPSPPASAWCPTTRWRSSSRATSPARCAPWRAQATGSVLRTLALGALAALLLAAVLRQLAKLDVAHERFALAAAGSDDGIWDWDLQAETACKSLRRARELQGLPLEPETQPIAELKASLTYHPDDAHRRASAMQAHLDGDTPAYEVDYRVFRDGEYRWIHVRALCSPPGVPAASRMCKMAGIPPSRNTADPA